MYQVLCQIVLDQKSQIVSWAFYSFNDSFKMMELNQDKAYDFILLHWFKNKARLPVFLFNLQ